MNDRIDHADQTETLVGAATAAPSSDVTAPQLEVELLGGRYLLEERIASGGMAAVWRARDRLLARTVAIKLLHDHLAADEAFRERFRREAVSAAKLAHPNVVGLYDTGTDGDRVYLVMEYVDGPTLRDVIRDLGALDPEQAAAVAEQVARALHYAHRRGLIHRDIKPANILIGPGGVVKVTDFGIAKADEPAAALTRSGMVLGTAAYVSPEQVLSQPLSGKADQFALGVVLYEALTGRQPYSGDSAMATAAARLRAEPEPMHDLRPDLPEGLVQIVMRALARHPDDRFPTAGHLAEALAAFAHDRPALPGPADRDPARAAAGRDRGPAAGVPVSVTADESFLRSEGRWLAAVFGLVLLAGTLGGVGLATGVLESGGGLPLRLAQERGSAGEAGQAVSLPGRLIQPTAAHAFDPPPGDEMENDADLPSLFDGNPETTWRTELYDDDSFGDVKDGVGFYVDLGARYSLDLVALRTATPGISYELRVADIPAERPDGWRVVGSVDGDRALSEVRFAQPVITRYLLVWVTGELQPRAGRYVAEFSAMAIRGQRL